MILIPIGTEQKELKTVPLITCTIIGLCVFVYLCQPDTRPGQALEVYKRLAAALEYYRTNPDLTPAPALRQISDDALPELSPHDAVHDADSRPKRQARLDEITGAWLDAMWDGVPGQWGLIPSQLSWPKLVTSMFIHGGLFHLIFNMLFLYLTAPFLEAAWGGGAFLAFYLLGGIFAGFFYALGASDSVVPAIGASGAIAAVMGAFMVRYPFARIRLLALVLWRPIRFSGPAWGVLSFWFLGELAQAYDTPAHLPLGGGVANWAHVWGFVFGVAVAAVDGYVRPEEEEPVSDTVETSPPEVERDPFVEHIERLLDRGDKTEAMRLLAEWLSGNPNSPDLAARYWELSRDGAMTAHPEVSLRIIKGDLQNWRERLGLERWQEFHATVPAAIPDVSLTLRLVRLLSRLERGNEAERLLQDCYRQMSPSTAPADWVAFAEYCLFRDSLIASEVVARALTLDLPAEDRASLERQLRRKSGARTP